MRTDVHEGDIVEAYRTSWPIGQKVVGPVRRDGISLSVAEFVVGWTDGGEIDDDKVVTVVSRAPRPLYVNHPRTEPVPGDVVRDADSDDPGTWTFRPDSTVDLHPWVGHWSGGDDPQSSFWYEREALPDRLRLLVDGETGQVVR